MSAIEAIRDIIECTPCSEPLGSSDTSGMPGLVSSSESESIGGY